MAQAPREVDPPPAGLPVGPDERPSARPVAPGGVRRVLTGLAVGVGAGLLLLLDLDDERDAAGRTARGSDRGAGGGVLDRLRPRARGWRPRMHGRPRADTRARRWVRR